MDLSAVGLMGVAACPALSQGETNQPNIVIVMTDDQGWGQVGYNGHPRVLTPVVDEMAASGLRLDRFYAQPVCAPARASLLTGRHHTRTGTIWVPFVLDLNEQTFPELLQQDGYATGHFGKWHLGPVEIESPYCANHRGYEESLSAWNQFDVDPSLTRNGVARESFTGAGSDIVVEEALKFISDAVSSNRPFFTMVWMAAPHAPREPFDEYRIPYTNYSQEAENLYGEIHEADHALGLLRDGLDALGVRSNTMLLFCSDNGGTGAPPEDKVDVPFSTGKGGISERGLKVPAVIEWPAMIQSNRASSVPCGLIDLFPTLLDIAGIDPTNSTLPLDGISIKPLLEGTMTERSSPIGFWELGRDDVAYSNLNGGVDRVFIYEEPEDRVLPYPIDSAWIDNEYKLVLLEGKADALYNVEHDPLQKTNLISTYPAMAAQMNVELNAWKVSVENSMRGDDYPGQPAQLELSTSAISVPEGSTNAFGVRLSDPPTNAVTVTVAHISGDADITVQSGSETLTFTTNNWETYQYPVLAAAQDVDFTDGTATIRCSADGMTDQNLTATESDDETNPAYSLPWEEPFDARTNGAIAGQNGWTGTGTVQTETTQSGAKALSLSESSVAHSFDGNPSNIWITLWAQPVPGIEPETIASGASAVFYVNTNNLLVAYSNETPIEISGATVSNGWNKIEISCDYVSKLWNLELNGVPTVGNFPFYGAPASFQALEISENTTNALFVDSVHLTDMTDSTDVDADADGVPDSWERKHFGGTHILPGAMASNGVNTVRQAYIAGLNPTNAASSFRISELRSLTSKSVLRWNSASGRVYSVYWSSNLLNGFILLSNNVPWTSSVFTNETYNAETKGFYKIEVELEGIAE